MPPFWLASCSVCDLTSGLLQGIMLVYDITNEKSFDNIRNWIRNIEEVGPAQSHDPVAVPTPDRGVVSLAARLSRRGEDGSGEQV